jgi:hypothetical protein
MSRLSATKRGNGVVSIGALGLLVALSLLGSEAVMAQTGNTIISISSFDQVPFGGLVNVGIAIENQPGRPGLGGFDLQIVYDSSAMSLVGAASGPLLDSAAWEYFSFRQGEIQPGLRAVRLVAVADISNGNVHPNSFLVGKTGQLATVQFRMSSDSAYQCHVMPLRFFWNDCGDNGLSSISGDTLYLSQEVRDYDGTLLLTPPALGTTDGAPDYCFGAGGAAAPVRQVTFAHGSVAFECTQPPYPRGDLNLNGIANEIADLEMYCDYFLHGLRALPETSRELSIAASDVNADGRTLTFQDAVYLERVVLGDSPTFPRKSISDTLTAYFHQDMANHVIQVSYPDSLAGAWFTVMGNIAPEFSFPPQWRQDYYYDGTYTQILILGLPTTPYGSGIWFSYQGTGSLQRVMTADWHDNDIVAVVIGGGYNCGDFDGSGGTDISDAVYLIKYIFGGGTPPQDSGSGDVNCDSACDVGDVVYLMQYIFAGGPGPCSGCK